MFVFCPRLLLSLTDTINRSLYHGRNNSWIQCGKIIKEKYNLVDPSCIKELTSYNVDSELV